MSRPSVSEEAKAQLEAVVEERADVPAHHLTFEQQVPFVLTELEKESNQNGSGGLLS
ncbi:hypothetical protein [Haloquadratum walsbyi]|uniref:Uncharacterized protein n=1 Tax=Haloquadratum walsbyi J07HQW2 TaxID=1238425 RepID=U1NBD5_9EURY|nr:hypothetical protein [Haloquadratum walsbyi]ERG94195.1 MAG: hypothetical protein J07HQW2_00629 [Haloquadratum walsbyi J07HQW2]